MLVEEHVLGGEKPREYTELARAGVSAGLSDHVAAFIENTFDGSDRDLLEILEDIVHAGDAVLFKRLIPLLWRKPSSAYRVCAVLALAYPDKAQDIARVIRHWSGRLLPHSFQSQPEPQLGPLTRAGIDSGTSAAPGG